MAGLPALVQVSLRAVRSSTCTVPRCTRDGLAAQVVDVDAVGVALERGQLRARGEVGDHVDGLLPLGVVGERRHAQLVLLGRDARQDAVERAVLELGLEPELLRDGLAEVDVHADDRRAVGVDELVRRVRRVRAERRSCRRRRRRRHHRGQRRVLLDGGERGSTRRRPPPWARRPTAAVAACPAPGEDGGERSQASAAGSWRGSDAEAPPDGPWVRRGCSHFRPRRAHRCARVVTEHLSTVKSSPRCHTR